MSRFNWRRLEALKSKLEKIDTTNPPREIKDCYNQWASRYYAETLRNYKQASRGGGDWKPLTKSTKRQKKKKTSILIRTGTLMNSLAAKSQGSAQTFIRGGVRVGFSGTKRHPSGRASIKDIATFHQKGKGVPRRPILRQPSGSLKSKMTDDLLRAVDKMGGGRL